MRLKRLFSVWFVLTFSAAVAATPTPASAPIKTVKSWGNSGRSSAIAAFETAHWANMTNQTDIAVESVVFPENDRLIFQEIFDALPSEQRVTFKNPSRMAVAVLSSLARRPVFGRKPPTGFDILAEESKGADDVLLTYRFNNDARIDRQAMRRFPDGWKFMMPSSDLQDARRRKTFETMAKSLAATMQSPN